MLTNVRAADVLANLLTVAVDRTDANAAAIQKYLAEIGKADAYAKDRPTPPEDNRLSYNQIFKGAVVFVQEGGGARFADPTLQSRSQDELLEQLNQLQSYNIQQFMTLAKKRESVESLRMYLRQIGEFEKFHAWAQKNAPDAAVALEAPPSPATQPAGESPTPEQIAARMKALTDYARQIEWRKAQAAGVSAADFDKQWGERVEKYKDQVAAKVEGVRALGGSLSKSELTSSPPVNSTAQPQQSPHLGPMPGYGSPPPVQPNTARQLPPPVESKFTPEYFQRKNDEIYWNPWEGRWYNRGRPVGY